MGTHLPLPSSTHCDRPPRAAPPHPRRSCRPGAGNNAWKSHPWGHRTGPRVLLGQLGEFWEDSPEQNPKRLAGAEVREEGGRRHGQLYRSHTGCGARIRGLAARPLPGGERPAQEAVSQGLRDARQRQGSKGGSAAFRTGAGTTGAGARSHSPWEGWPVTKRGVNTSPVLSLWDAQPDGFGR